MKRRDFLTAGALAGLASTSPMAALGAPGGAADKQFLELRLGQIDSAEQQKAMLQFLGKALIPALNRIGVEPVGVFTINAEANPNVEGVHNLYMLLPHNSLESATTWVHQLGGDHAFLDAGADVLGATKQEPAYARMESSLLLAFDAIPKVEVPAKAKSRVFRLRIYESHSIAAGQRKIEMFNDGGEIALFRRTGLTPVFFGEALIGSKLPNLTYMLGFDDRETADKAWAAFLGDPEWDRLKRDPYYKDTVSNITNIWLNPAPCSQI